MKLCIGSLVVLLSPLIAVSCFAAEKNKIPDAVEALLREADTFELYSLDPSREGKNEKEGFHSWKILGSTKVTAETRQELAAALGKGVQENEGIVAACFNPRHGLRLVKGNQTIDLVICFECYSISYYGGEQKEGYFLVTRSPQPTFDAVLREAKVELAKQAKE